MIYVIDASVAIKWFVAEERHDNAIWFTDHKELLRAPDFLLVEVSNIAWKKCLRGQITPFHASAIAQSVPIYIADLDHASGLLKRALEMALSLRHPVYDCLYLSCAERWNGIVVTADKRFFDTVSKSEYADQVLLLEDFSPRPVP